MAILSPSHQGALYLKHFWYWEAHFHFVECSISPLSIHAARSMIVLISLSYLITYPISPPCLWYFAPLAAPLSLWWTLSSPFLPCVPLEVAVTQGLSMLGTLPQTHFKWDLLMCCCPCLIAAVVAWLWVSQLLKMGHWLCSGTMLCGEENASILYFIFLFVFSKLTMQLSHKPG